MSTALSFSRKTGSYGHNHPAGLALSPVGEKIARSLIESVRRILRIRSVYNS
jgi:hypothetical protein